MFILFQSISAGNYYVMPWGRGDRARVDILIDGRLPSIGNLTNPSVLGVRVFDQIMVQLHDI